MSLARPTALASDVCSAAPARSTWPATLSAGPSSVATYQAKRSAPDCESRPGWANRAKPLTPWARLILSIDPIYRGQPRIVGVAVANRRAAAWLDLDQHLVGGKLRRVGVRRRRVRRLGRRP